MLPDVRRRIIYAPLVFSSSWINYAKCSIFAERPECLVGKQTCLLFPMGNQTSTLSSFSPGATTCTKCDVDEKNQEHFKRSHSQCADTKTRDLYVARDNSPPPQISMLQRIKVLLQHGRFLLLFLDLSIPTGLFLDTI